MKKVVLFLFTIVFTIHFNSDTFGQTDTSKNKNQSDVYQIRLQDTVKCIQQIEYEKTGEPIKGYLNDDKKVIYLEDYKVNNRVKLKVIYENGKEEEILRSPCSIELKYTL